MGLSLFLSSTGPSVGAQGHLMGEYQYDASSNSFKQRSTSQIGESSYLYQFSQNTWIVGPFVGSSSGNLCSTYDNYNNSQTVPSAYWRFRTYLNTWQLDENIRVEYGGLNECNLSSVHLFGQVARSLEGMEGTYSKTDTKAYLDSGLSPSSVYIVNAAGSYIRLQWSQALVLITILISISSPLI